MPQLQLLRASPWCGATEAGAQLLSVFLVGAGPATCAKARVSWSLYFVGPGDDVQSSAQIPEMKVLTNPSLLSTFNFARTLLFDSGSHYVA
jgi:hypothetical protein